jgi:hypothetical protein
MASRVKRNAFMTWSMVDAFLQATENIDEVPLALAVKELKPLVELTEDESLVKLKVKLIAYLNDVLGSEEIMNFDKQQSYIHMLCVLIEHIVNRDPQPKRKAGWQKILDALVDLIQFLDEEAGDIGAAQGCAWADQIIEELWY